MMSSSPRENDADAVGTGLQSGDVDLRHAHAMSMDVTTLYTCLWLRSAVFHGEQRCTEPDLDGRELEPTTVLVWASVGGRPVGTLRILDDQDHLVIGRVAVDVASRGLHIGRRMMDLALEIAGADGREVALHARLTSRTGTAILDSSLPVRTLRRLGLITSRWFCVAKAA